MRRAARASVGQIVHYRPYITPGVAPLTPPCQAAIVVATHDTGVDPVWLSPAERELMPGQLVTLAVFTVDGIDRHDAECEQAAETGGTWHWPSVHEASLEW